MVLIGGKLWKDRIFAERPDGLERLWEEDIDEFGGLR